MVAEDFEVWVLPTQDPNHEVIRANPVITHGDETPC
jgi:hypothetical protein